MSGSKRWKWIFAGHSNIHTTTNYNMNNYNNKYYLVSVVLYYYYYIYVNLPLYYVRECSNLSVFVVVLSIFIQEWLQVFFSLYLTVLLFQYCLISALLVSCFPFSFRFWYLTLCDACNREKVRCRTAVANHHWYTSIFYQPSSSWLMSYYICRLYHSPSVTLKHRLYLKTQWGVLLSASYQGSCLHTRITNEHLIKKLDKNAFAMKDKTANTHKLFLMLVCS